GLRRAKPESGSESRCLSTDMVAFKRLAPTRPDSHLGVSDALTRGFGFVVFFVTGCGFDAVLAHQLAAVFAVDVDFARGVRDVAAILLEQVDDVVALEGADPTFLGFFERVLTGRQIARGADARRVADHVGQIRNLDGVALAERARALDDVDQLADVAGP